MNFKCCLTSVLATVLYYSFSTVTVNRYWTCSCWLEFCMNICLRQRPHGLNLANKQVVDFFNKCTSRYSANGLWATFKTIEMFGKSLEIWEKNLCKVRLGDWIEILDIKIQKSKFVLRLEYWIESHSKDSIKYLEL